MVVSVNVRDFGAVGDGVTDDREAIQNAIDYASSQGGGTVHISAGTYTIAPYSNGVSKPTSGIVVKNNVSLVGDGIGITTLKLKDGSTEDVTGIVRTHWSDKVENVSISNLSIDGNREATTGHKVIGFICGVKTENGVVSKNITVDSVEAKNCSSYGFDPHEITDNMVIKNSISHNNGLDGFVADYLTNSTFSNNVAWDNDRHGYNVTTSTPGVLLKDNVAYENGSTGLVFQRGGFDIPWPENSTVQGGAYFDNANEGILVRLTKGTYIRGVDVFDNGKQGVRFRAATNSLMEGSIVRNNSQLSAGVYDDVNFGEEQDSVTGNTYGSVNNTVQYNTVFSDGLVRTRWNIREQADSSTDYNMVKGNVTWGGITGLAKVSGAHSQLVKFNPKDPALTGAYKYGTDAGETITDKATNDTVLGFGGNDSLVGSGGNDIIAGGNDNDTILGGTGNDHLYGEAGSDSLRGDVGDDSIYGDSGNDSMDGVSGNDWLFGGDGNDTIYGGSDNDTIFGGSGNDNISGGDGNDRIFGDDGLNSISGGKGNDTVFGGESADTVSGDSGNDFIFGFGGDDSINGNDGNDSIGGGAGNDSIWGGSESDIVSGGDGNDSLSGDSGNDTIGGDAGNDTIVAGSGADSVSGGTGDDVLTGSIDLDKDIFYFSATSGHDIIQQFDTTYDLVQVSSEVFFNVAILLVSLDSDVNGNAVLEDGASWSITFEGIQVSQLNSSDFVIV